MQNQLGYCTVPQAMAIFSYIDLLGFLLRPDTSSEDSAQKEQTSKNITYFIQEYYVKKNYVLDNDVKPLINLYRHGMMHQFLPKSVDVFKNPVRNTQPPFKVIQNRIEEGRNKRRYVLNVSDFTECFLIALSDIRNDFDSKDETVKRRNFNMYLKWKKLCESDEEEANKQVPSKKNKVEPTVRTTIQPNK